MAIEFRKEKPAFINFCQVIIYKGNVFFYNRELGETYIHTYTQKKTKYVTCFFPSSTIRRLLRANRTDVLSFSSIASLSLSLSFTIPAFLIRCPASI